MGKIVGLWDQFQDLRKDMGKEKVLLCIKLMRQ